MRRLFILFLLLPLTVSAAGDYEKYFSQMWSSGTSGNSEVLGSVGTEVGARIVVSDSITSYSFGKAGSVYGFRHDGSEAFKYSVYGIPSSTSVYGEYIAVGTQGRGHAIVLDSSGNTLWRKGTEFKTSYAHKVNLVDITGDGRPELFSTVNYGMKGTTLTAYSIDGEQLFVEKLGSRDYPYSIAAADVNGDGVREAVIGFGTSAPEVTREGFQNIRVSFDGSSEVRAYSMEGGIIWAAPTPKGVVDVEAADTDDDGMDEVFAATIEEVIALNHDGSRIWGRKLNGRISGIALVNSSGELNVAAGASRLYLVGPDGVYWSYGAVNVRDLEAEDLDDDGCPEIVAASDEVYVVDCEGSLVWNSEDIGGVDQVHIANINSLEGFEIMAASDDDVTAFSTGGYGKIKRADAAFENAQSLYRDRRFGEVGQYARSARAAYKQLGEGDEDNAFDLELNAAKLVNASRLLNQSINLFEQGRYEEAEKAAQEGLSYSRSVGDIRLTTSLQEVLQKATTRPMANDLLNVSRGFFERRLWMNCSVTAQQASDYYTRLGDADKANQSRLLKDKALAALEGEGVYLQALNLTGSGEFAGARKKMDSSRASFMKTGYEQGLEKIMVLEDVIEWLEFRKTWLPRLFYLFILLALLDASLFFLLIAVFVQSRGGLPWLFQSVEDLITAFRSQGVSVLSVFIGILDPGARKKPEGGARARKKGGLETLDNLLEDM